MAYNIYIKLPFYFFIEELIIMSHKMKSFRHRKLHLEKSLYLRYTEAINIRLYMVGMMALEAPSFCLLFYFQAPNLHPTSISQKHWLLRTGYHY
jgi:hypothetical protein